MKRNAVFCFVGILCCILLLFAGPARAAETGTTVYTGRGDGVVRLFTRTKKGALAVISTGSSTWFAAATPGGTGGSFEVCPNGRSLPCMRACRYGETIALLFENGSGTLVALSDGTEIYALFSLEAFVGEIRGIAVDGQDRLWYCCGKELFVCDCTGTPLARYDLPATANAMAAVSGGRMLVFCSDGTTFFAQDIPGELSVLENEGTVPLVALGDDDFVDGLGVVCRYSAGRVVRTAVAGDPPHKYDVARCGVSGELAFYADSGSSVQVCRLATGEKLGGVSFAGSVQALAGDAVLLLQNTDYAIAFPDYGALVSVMSPPPEESMPAVASGEEVTGSGESGTKYTLPEGVRLQDDTVEVPRGTTAAALRRYSGVEEVLTADGSRASGACRTGMRLILTDRRTFTIVVLGDANGSGTVNTADIQALQKDILGEAPLEGAFRMAADMDGNGELNTADLVLLARVMQAE